MSKEKRKAGKPSKAPPVVFSSILIEAAKKAGFTDEQIAAVDTEEALRALVTKVRPQSILDVVPQEKPPKPKATVDPVEMVSREKDFSIEISPQSALTWKRGDYEQSELDRFINRNGIKNLVRVLISRGYVPNKTSKYETNFNIHYRDPK